MQVSWESVGAIASLISAATVVGAVIVALRQVRVGALQVDHLRRATQLEGTMKIFDKLNSDQQQRARQFIAFELRERMRDPVFSAEVDLLGYAHGHWEIDAMRLLEMIGVYVKHGLLDEEIIFDHWLPAVLNTWRDLDEAGVIARHRAIEGPTMWENFEELHRRAVRWEAIHDPSAAQRVSARRPAEAVAAEP